MTRPRFTVQQLADAAGIDPDEILIAAWDLGFDSVRGPSDLVPKGAASTLRYRLRIPSRRELGSLEYWRGRFNVDETSFQALLTGLQISPDDGRGRLNKIAITRLRRELQRRSLPVAPPPEPKAPSPPLLSVLPLAAPVRRTRFELSKVGRERPLKFLSADQVRVIHYALVDDFLSHSDPINPAGVRDDNLLESAVFRPQTQLYGVPKYPTVEMAAAALLHGIVHDHPFHNGNKRTALVAMLVFLDENSILLTCHEDELFKLVLQLAQHALAAGPTNELATARWMQSHAG